jgi:tetratricopeptide (TPR) repeat protein
MSQNETMKSDFPRDLRGAKRELFRACEQLRQTNDKAARKELERKINELRIDLGWELLDRGDYERGLALYVSLPSRTYGEVKCNGISRALAGMKLYAQARELLEKGLKRFPTSYSLWVGMGALHADLGNDFDALECFEAAARYAPGDASAALFNKVQILAKLGCYEDAVSILKDLVRKDPYDPRYSLELGYCYLDMGQPEEALLYYKTAMELWQGNPTAYEGGCLYMGTYASYRTLGMLKEAMAVAQEGLKRFPEEDPGLYQNLADAYNAMGWRNDAVRVLKKGIETFPDDKDLKEVLRDIESGMDDPEDGKNPPILGLLVLMALLRKGFGKGRK